MFFKGYLLAGLCICLAFLPGCSTTSVTEKTDTGLTRPKILEEDISDTRNRPPAQEAPVPSTAPGAANQSTVAPGTVQPQSTLPDPSTSSRTPRRFHWKDSR